MTVTKQIHIYSYALPSCPHPGIERLNHLAACIVDPPFRVYHIKFPRSVNIDSDFYFSLKQLTYDPSVKVGIMRTSGVLFLITGWSVVAAFLPRSNFCTAFSNSFSCARAIPEIRAHIDATRPTQASTAEYDTCASPSTTSARRAIAPVVLVSSDNAILGAFAQHLSADSVSEVIDLSEVAKQYGSKGVEKILAGSKTDGVLVCPANACLGHPELQTLVRSHPLTVHLAVEGEDPAVRTRCEGATKYTVIIDGDSGAAGEEYTYAKDDLLRLVNFARKLKPSKEDIALDMGKNTFFLSVTFPDFKPHVDLLPDLSGAVDAMELRVDLLADHDPYSVLKQLSILRRYTGHLPVVYTVRSKGQCGAFADDPDALFRLAKWGLRSGAEVMDVEANWPMSYREGFIKQAREDYPSAVLVGSYHVVGRKTTEEQARKLFIECYHHGTVDAVKVRCGGYGRRHLRTSSCTSGTR